MKNGVSDFEYYHVLNRRDIAEIVDNSKQLRIEDLDFIKNATYEDVQAAYILMSFEKFLKARNIRKTFEVDTSDKG